MRDQRLGRQRTFDKVRGRRHLRHAIGATPASVFRTYSYDHAELCRYDVQPLAAIWTPALTLNW